MKLLRLFGRSALCAAVVAGSMALAPTKAAAASFEIDFCVVNAAECTGDNLTEASLLFEEILTGSDPNDYNLTMTFVGTGAGTIDQVQFTIDGVATPAGYESRPTVVGPAGTGAWTVFYDNVANATSCQSDGGSQGVCANQTEPLPGNTLLGPAKAGTNVWTWFVDLNDALAPISSATNVNLRATFDLTGNFSPSGGTFTTTTTTTTTPSTTPSTDTSTPSTPSTPSGVAPEPTVMTLLGAGLVLAGRRLRRRNA